MAKPWSNYQFPGKRRFFLAVLLFGAGLLVLFAPFLYNLHWIFITEEGGLLREEGNVLQVEIRGDRILRGQIVSQEVVWFQNISIVSVQVEIHPLIESELGQAPQPDFGGRVIRGESLALINPWADKPSLTVERRN